MIILKVLLYILLSILAVFLLVLLIPIDYHIMASKYEIVKYRGKVTLLWGMLQFSYGNDSLSSPHMIIKPLGIPISIDNSKVSSPQKSKVKISKKPEASLSRSKDKLKLLLREINKELLFSLLDTIRKIFHFIRPKVFKLKAKYGLDDPYDNALLLAIITSFYPLLKDYEVNLVPSFEDSVLEGELEIRGKIAVVLLLFILVKFMLSKPIRKIIKIIRKNKEEKAYVH